MERMVRQNREPSRSRSKGLLEDNVEHDRRDAVPDPLAEQWRREALRAHGGPATGRGSANRGNVQRKATIGSAHDPLEREADRAAQQVVSGGRPEISAAASPGTQAKSLDGSLAGRPDRDTAAREPVGQDGPSSESTAVDRALSSGGGATLPEPLRSRMEDGFGADLSGVRIHTGAASSLAAQEIQAEAFTSGQDIHFAAGRFSPGTPAGDRLIAHEVTHTIQQGGGGVPAGAAVQGRFVQRQPERTGTPIVEGPDQDALGRDRLGYEPAAPGQSSGLKGDQPSMAEELGPAEQKAISDLEARLWNGYVERMHAPETRKAVIADLEQGFNHKQAEICHEGALQHHASMLEARVQAKFESNRQAGRFDTSRAALMNTEFHNYIDTRSCTKDENGDEQCRPKRAEYHGSTHDLVNTHWQQNGELRALFEIRSSLQAWSAAHKADFDRIAAFRPVTAGGERATQAGTN